MPYYSVGGPRCTQLCFAHIKYNVDKYFLCSQSKTIKVLVAIGRSFYHAKNNTCILVKDLYN